MKREEIFNGSRGRSSGLCLPLMIRCAHLRRISQMWPFFCVFRGKSLNDKIGLTCFIIFNSYKSAK